MARIFDEYVFSEELNQILNLKTRLKLDLSSKITLMKDFELRHENISKS